MPPRPKVWVPEALLYIFKVKTFLSAVSVTLVWVAVATLSVGKAVNRLVDE